jgi:hypothetical protein
VIHELRIYHCVPNRLKELLALIEHDTLPLWKRHGIQPAGFWTVLVGPSNHDLYYMLRWDSLAERELKWTAFSRDPDWIAKRAHTEENGALVASVTNLLLQPTSFSSVT